MHKFLEKIAPATLTALLLMAAQTAHAQSCNKPNILILLDVSGSMADSNGSSSRMKQAMDGIDAALGATNTGNVAYENLASWALGVFPEPFTGSKDSDGYYNNGFCMVAKHSTDQSIVTKVGFSTGNRTAIHTALNTIYNGGAGPSANDDTPIYQALQAGANSAAFQGSTSNYILLVTDGQQDCIPHSAKPKPTTPALEGDFDSTVDGSYSGGGEDFSEDNVPAFRTLVNDLSSNVTIFAVGFNITSSDTPDGARTLNMISATAGTSISGCNAQETDPTQDDNCYYQATDANSLQQAIGSIVAQINIGACGNTQNKGLCHDGTWQCQDGVNTCVGAVGPEDQEQCDGLDHDCDGNYGNVYGDGQNDTLTKGCGGDACVGTLKCQALPNSSTPDQYSNTCQIAGGGAGVCDCKSGVTCGTISAGCKAEGPSVCACTTGTQTCVDEGDGILGFGDCVGATQPQTEICNGLDDNCDGQVDEGTVAPCLTSCGTPGTRACNGKAGLSNDCVPNEGACDCNTGDTRPCGTAGNGCQQGEQICQYGQWTTGCIGGSQGSTEICNGLDDDCDGKIDNGAVCPSGETCVCGSCEPACNGGSCSNGGQCDAQDVCQIDYCPNGTCDNNGECNANGLPTQPQSTSVAKDPAIAQTTKTVASGCGCHDTQPLSGLLAALFIGVLPFLRRRKS